MDILTITASAVILTAISVNDIKSRTIPPRLTAALLATAVLSLFAGAELAISQRIIGFFVISAPFLTLALLIPGSIGGGDIKLCAVCGFLIGWQAMIASAMAAAVINLTAVLTLAVYGKIRPGSASREPCAMNRLKTESIPYAPSICVCTLLSVILIYYP